MVVDCCAVAGMASPTAIAEAINSDFPFIVVSCELIIPKCCLPATGTISIENGQKKRWHRAQYDARLGPREMSSDMCTVVMIHLDHHRDPEPVK
jgi:hypothetical protein